MSRALRLDDQLCFALYRALAKVQRAYAPILAPLGVTYPQYLVLLALWERDAITLGELGERLGLDSGTLTPLLKRMEAAELVSRNRSLEDERRLVVALTPKGRRLEKKGSAVAAKVLCAFDLTAEAAIALRDHVSLTLNLTHVTHVTGATGAMDTTATKNKKKERSS